MKNLFPVSARKRFFVALLLSDKDIGRILWHNVLLVRHTGGYFRSHEAKRMFPLGETVVSPVGNGPFHKYDNRKEL